MDTRYRSQLVCEMRFFRPGYQIIPGLYGPMQFASTNRTIPRRGTRWWRWPGDIRRRDKHLYVWAVQNQTQARTAACWIHEVDFMLKNLPRNPNLSGDAESFLSRAETNPLWSIRWNEVVRQPWFQRGWVIQEALLGPDACVHHRLDISLSIGLSKVGTLFWYIVYCWRSYNLDNPRTTTHT